MSSPECPDFLFHPLFIPQSGEFHFYFFFLLLLSIRLLCRLYRIPVCVCVACGFCLCGSVRPQQECLWLWFSDNFFFFLILVVDVVDYNEQWEHTANKMSIQPMRKTLLNGRDRFGTVNRLQIHTFAVEKLSFLISVKHERWTFNHIENFRFLQRKIVISQQMPFLAVVWAMIWFNYALFCHVTIQRRGAWRTVEKYQFTRGKVFRFQAKKLVFYGNTLTGPQRLCASVSFIRSVEYFIRFFPLFWCGVHRWRQQSVCLLEPKSPPLNTPSAPLLVWCGDEEDHDFNRLAHGTHINFMLFRIAMNGRANEVECSVCSWIEKLVAKERMELESIAVVVVVYEWVETFRCTKNTFNWLRSVWKDRSSNHFSSTMPNEFCSSCDTLKKLVLKHTSSKWSTAMIIYNIFLHVESCEWSKWYKCEVWKRKIVECKPPLYESHQNLYATNFSIIFLFSFSYTFLSYLFLHFCTCHA